jgi:hypothetical protein
MAWSKKTRACKALYFSLQRTKQLSIFTEFNEAKDIPMQHLLFFNQHTSSQLRKQEAIILASRLDNEFTGVYWAEYEDEKSRATAIAEMVEVLLEADNTVETLSDNVNSNYKFLDEEGI